MVRRLYAVLIVVCALLFASPSAFAYEKLQGWCEDGNQTVTTGTLTSTTKVQRSYTNGTTGCTVTVYNAGTVVPATIYADNSGATKANPFTAAGSGQWFFYAANGRYDIKFSGAGIAIPFTLGDFQVSDGATPSFCYSSVTFSATPTFDAAACSIFKMTLTANVTSSTISNASTGRIIQFTLCQDGTGTRTFVWPASVLNAPTLTTNASVCTNTSMYYDGTNWRPWMPQGNQTLTGGLWVTGSVGTAVDPFRPGASITLEGNGSGTGPELDLFRNTNPGSTSGDHSVVWTAYDANGVRQKLGAINSIWMDTSQATGYSNTRIQAGAMVGAVMQGDVVAEFYGDTGCGSIACGHIGLMGYASQFGAEPPTGTLGIGGDVYIRGTNSQLGIGIAPQAGWPIYNQGILADGTGGIASDPLINSTNTENNAYVGRLRTSATAITLTTGTDFFAQNASKGAGSAVTNFYGFRCDSTFNAGATLNYCFYNPSTAPSFFNGDIRMANNVPLRGVDGGGTARPLIGMSSGVITIDGNGVGVAFGKPLVATGAGAGATLGLIGGSGPATGTQNAWAQFIDSTGANYWVPVWK